MKIGITYDLRADYLARGFTEEETAEFDRADTIDAIENALVHSGFLTDRIGHLHALIRRLAAGDRWDMVFNIAEGLRGFGREAQIPALLDAFAIPYTFSDPLVLSLTLHKGMTKHVIRDSGLPTADFAVVETAAAVADIRLPFPLFVKPVAEGTGKGITAASRIDSRSDLFKRCCELLAAFRQPVLVETFLPGREFTVGVIGTAGEAEILGVMEILLREGAEGDGYSLVNKEDYLQRVDYRIASDEAAEVAGKMALSVWRVLGCRDAGRVDLRADGSGMPLFMEVNPLAGLHPVHSDLPILCGLAGMDYQKLIDRIMESAMKRLGS
ncbi:MAG: D-alanine--D-alanine ligase [Deltaproteobacteria bacterium]|nr:D-alanine--D-alanine ligase [Deltaproteobacteria bacterium]